MPKQCTEELASQCSKDPPSPGLRRARSGGTTPARAEAGRSIRDVMGNEGKKKPRGKAKLTTRRAALTAREETAPPSMSFLTQVDKERAESEEDDDVWRVSIHPASSFQETDYRNDAVSQKNQPADCESIHVTPPSVIIAN